MSVTGQEQPFEFEGRTWTWSWDDGEFGIIAATSDWGDSVVLKLEPTRVPRVNRHYLPAAVEGIEDFETFFEALAADGESLAIFREGLFQPELQGSPLGDQMQVLVEKFRERWIAHQRAVMSLLLGWSSEKQRWEDRHRLNRDIAYRRIEAFLDTMEDAAAASIIDILLASWHGQQGVQPQLADLLITPQDRSLLSTHATN